MKGSTQNCPFNFLSWNIEGLANKISSDFTSFLNQYHIFCLQETWDADPDIGFYSSHFPEYNIFCCNAKRSIVGGRSMGGVIVFVKACFAHLITRISPNFEYGVLLKIDKSLLKLSTDCLFTSLYIPPENSPFYANAAHRGFDTFKEVLLSSNLAHLHLIVSGDLNARTGNHADFVSFGNNVPELSEYDNIINNDIGIPRCNVDAVTNKFGRAVIEFCKTSSCYIVNGRFGKDADKGEFTFVNENGCSTIDYFILSKELLGCITDFEVVNNVESSHLPVFLELKRSIVLNESTPVSKGTTRIKYTIDKNNCEDYFQTLANNIEKGCFDEFESELQNPEKGVNELLSLFETAVLNCSETFKKTWKNNHTKVNKDWFDEQCKNTKKIVKANQNTFRSKRSDHNLDKYLKSKQEYKYLCRDKKRAYYKDITNKIESSINNSKNFWFELKKINDKPCVKNDIPLPTWHEHFLSLFTTNTSADEQSANREAGAQSSNIDDFNGEIFNSYITDKEIIEAVDQLNVNKSASGTISPNQIKYGITALLPFIRKLFNHIFSKGAFPFAWAKFTIIPLHKKGNVNEPNNYRGIALLDVLSKLYICILAKRLSFYIEAYSKITESQA